MSPPLGLGVSVRWAEAGPADFTPILAIATAILVARFVVGVRLGPITVLVAATVGAVWAAAIAGYGVTVPTLVVVLIVAALRLWSERARSA